MTRRTTCCIAFLVCLPGACQRTNQTTAARSFDDNVLAAQTKKSLFVPAPGSPIAVAGGPGNVALADVNRDGKLDLLVVSGKTKGVSVLLGQGDGQFRAAAGSPVQVPEHPSELVARDLNGDGHLDLALASHDSYGVMLLLGDGKGGFALAPNSPIVMKEGKHPHTHGLEAGDLNGDGNLDLVTVNSNPDNDVSVAFGDGRGGFTRAPGSPFAVGPSPYPGALADLNGDGHLDIIATTTDRSQDGQPVTRELTVLFGDGRGKFRRSQAPLRTPHPWFVAVGDVNRDGKLDLVATHAERNELTVLLGDGKGGFAEATGSPFDLGHAAWRFALADVNRDGNLDVVAAGGGVRVLLGDGRGGFEPAPGSPFPTRKGTWQLVVGDLNGDGKLDLVASNLESDSVTVLLGQ
jgi:FG-GAP-like repeat/FG-GAP repeat